MNFKTTISTVVASMALTCSVFASPMSPSKCPSVQSIKSTNFSSVELIDKNTYFLTQNSDYDTEQQWMFYFGPILADNSEKALEKGKEKINFLLGDLELSNYEDRWVCLYFANDNENPLSIGATIYQDGSVLTSEKLKSLLKLKQ